MIVTSSILVEKGANSMFQHIVVPLDGSSCAEQAIPTAARLARASKATLLLLRVIVQPSESEWDSVNKMFSHPENALAQDIAAARHYLEHMTGSGYLNDVKVVTDVQVGMPAETILAFAHARRADLIVICSHGATGLRRWVMGSVAQKIARHSPVPALVLRQHGTFPFDPPDPSQETTARAVRVLVALDSSPLAEIALRPAAQLCAALAAPAHGILHLALVLHAIKGRGEQHGAAARSNAQSMGAARAYLSDVERRLYMGEFSTLNLSMSSSVTHNDDVAGTLINMAEQGKCMGNIDGFTGCDAIAMATHGRSGLQRWVLGSVTERILGSTSLPLLVVRPTAR
jgi:nucleotide-binding universal stress UspA family protein